MFRELRQGGSRVVATSWRQAIRPSHARHTGVRTAWQPAPFPKSAPKVCYADAGLAGFGFVSGGILVTEAANPDKHVHALNIYEYLTDSFAMVAGRIQTEWEDENRRVLLGLIASNTAVFGLWKMSKIHPRLGKFMWSNFACSFNGVGLEKRVHTLLTSAFSHNTILHLGVNMFMLWHFGSALLPPTESETTQRVRRRQLIQDASWLKSTIRQYQEVIQQPRSLNRYEFLEIYFTSAIASSVLSAVVSGLLGMGHVYSIGASGAVFGVLTAYCVMHPDRELLLYGALPITSDEMLKLSVAINGIGSIFQHAKVRAFASFATDVDFVGHLGGQAAAYAMTPQ
ncbi:hypothetical protein LEN26_018129 [Aphanomyces euteiches]|nr:hypothetical protein LEN26_018129 [Aphanomyces euteiches]KAH9114435.1 hypothetical protein AeMF1_011458 [Aphanomyces euteiches]KAH9185805.1 hypothetical protein AeNC1_012216 [Aphanomyces euteiches]